MTLSDPIASLIEPCLHDLGFRLVQVRMMGQAPRSRTLQIMAEPQDPSRTMTVDDCAQISRSVSALLDVEDPIGDGYLLEVTSPGIDRPLVRAEDYARYTGWVAKVETETLIEGRRRFKGVIGGLDEDRVVLEDGGARFVVPLAQIKKARLELDHALKRARAAEAGRAFGE